MTVSSIIGWIGTITYILAYVSLSMRWIKAETYFYHLLNALGGMCLVINAYVLMDVPSLAVNIAWILIAAVSVIRIMLDRKREKVMPPREPGH